MDACRFQLVLQGLSKAELLEAIEEVKDATSSRDYRPPCLSGIIPYMSDGDDDAVSKEFQAAAGTYAAEKALPMSPRSRERLQVDSSGDLSLQEMRLLFLSLLKAAYESQVETGELAGETLQAIALDKSLEFTNADVCDGGRMEGMLSMLLFFGSLHVLLNDCIS